MNESAKTQELVHVACEICLREIPSSEVPIEEAGDYVMHFCGLDCYKAWRERYDKEQ
jgi:hypothetical protein